MPHGQIRRHGGGGAVAVKNSRWKKGLSVPATFGEIAPNFSVGANISQQKN
jgi:hypothetical protein